MFLCLFVSLSLTNVSTTLVLLLCLQAYLREGVALQQLGHHGDALAAFAAGLAQEPANGHLLSGLTDTALRSPLKGTYCMDTH